MSDAGKAVFLSYASQDAEAVKKIADALRAAGVEVWFDAEGGLEHGDEWDAKIRRQIKECVLFLPIISANTQAREEGYFRIEWELAAQRALGIASGVAFILPIVIDDTREPDALVPDRFRSVQWTRLRGGELTPEVKARFLKLWSHRTGALKQAAAVAAEIAPAPVPPRRRVMLPWVVLGLAAIVAAWFIFKPRRSPEEIAKVVADAQKPAPAVTPPAPAAAPLSEARQLAEKARALFDSLDGTRDDYKLAEELITQAKAKDATDAEVCAAEAQLHERFLQRGWDTSDTRRESARAAVQRAIRLDPKSFEARWAQASLLAYTGSEGEEKARQLRELRRERPTDKRILRTLGSTLDRLGRLEEAIPIFDESAALPGGDPLSLYSKSQAFWFAGRTAEAEAAIEASIAQRPFTSALLMNVWYKATLHGDLDRARALLNRINPAELAEDRACFFAFYVEMLSRRPDAAIARLAVVPRDWLNDNFRRGPKATLAGDAQQLAGRPDAAALEWRAALKLVDQRLAASPNDGRLLNARFGLLVRLGQREEAERLLGVLNQVLGSDADAISFVMSNAYMRLGRNAEAINQISAGLKRSRRAVLFTAADLRLNPEWDPLRSEPAFAAVIAEAEQIEQAAAIAATPPPPAVARDWPKNPELKRAIAFLDGLETIPEDFRLAEEITQRVLDKNPTDPEAVTAMARVHSMWLLRGWDRSTARYQKAKATAERAIQLAPDEPEAYVALAIHLYARGAESQRALELAQRAVDLDPSQSRFHRMRDNCLWIANVPAGSVFDEPSLELENEGLRKALAAARRTVELFPKDPLVRYELSRHYRDIGRWEDFEKVNDEALALAPLANALVWKARGRFGLHGDLPGMKAVLDRVPARVRGIERTVFAYFLYAAYTGNTAEGLDALNSMTETWMIDFDYRGPKALLAAALLEQAGKKELARVQYDLALQELSRARSLNPEDNQAYLNEAWMKHGLGRDDEARAALRIFNESIGHPYLISPMATWWFQAIPANLLMGERATGLALMREAVANFPRSRATLRGRLAADPRMAPFRADPEIKAILAEPAEKPAAAAPAVDGKSVAVLAFANLSDDKANEYFSDGISEELLNVLAKVPGLKVTARTSSFHFKGKDTSIPEIARQLGVAYVVEGSVRKAGDKVRITAQLIKAADGFHVWSDTFTRDLKDVFAVQDEIAGLIARNLSLKLGSGSPRKAAPVNPEAFELYVQARQAWNLRTAEGFDRAEQMLNRALVLAPDFVRARAALIDVVQMSELRLGDKIGSFGQRNSPELDRLLGLAHDVMAADPELAEIYATLGTTLQAMWRKSEVEPAYRRAVELNPNYATGHHWLGMHLAQVGRMDEALAELKLASELDPLSFIILDNYGWLLNLAGRQNEALRQVDRALALNPGYDQTMRVKASVLAALGRTSEARALAKQVSSRERVLDVFMLADVGLIFEAKALLASLDPRSVRFPLIPMLAVGQREDALNSLSDLSGASYGEEIEVIFRPMFDPIRNDPRFVGYLATVGLTESHALAQAWRAAHLPEKVETKP